MHNHCEQYCPYNGNRGINYSSRKTFSYFGNCLEPAIKDGHIYFLNNLASYISNYQINDIVLFKHDKKTWISRILALSNDTIKITDGNIIVNGKALQDGSIERNWTDWKYGSYAIDNQLLIPTDHVFVLSDNLSAHHDDSRVFGPIAKNSILGLIW